ncbi:ribonuclease HII [Fulvimarina sp. 2208YS6-2-32]|uniref:Ribonuclease HII n=1 Tax=Fulvimarina uroteuthidis TaxID=3098149 RepID=A0ABU5HXR1_9HYPH|nr:ribonuclease HII [Fulvimarina sp. 2208YS6-2-32]MDY8107923.1 ribonuclease HII [Fulvimarina sp. 2208YS6-2-32]
MIDSGSRWIAGVDEVGRGPLAGPVVAAAVVFESARDVPEGIDDSKRLSADERTRLYDAILANAHVAIASTPAAVIDRINIRQATLKAMEGALLRLPIRPTNCLIDGRDLPPAFSGIATGIIKGDRISVSIAAASIVAKVTRDRMMAQADRTHPGYGFSAHVGYGSPAHLAALARLGPCPLHRMSFSPIRTRPIR